MSENEVEVQDGETSQGAVGLGNESVNNLVEALAVASQKTGKQQGTGPLEGSTHSMYRNIKPPRPYTTSQNFKTWFSQLMEYANLVKIPNDQRRAYVINLLDEKAYKAVELLQVPGTVSFDEFTAKLKARFESARTTGDYKLQLRSRYQKPGEDFETFADALLELVENGYPEAVFDFKVELARDSFLQGVCGKRRNKRKIIY